jgi:hypothetical protein
MQPPKIIAVSEKIYRKLLRLYPQSYRREFGDLMALLFRDQCRDAWQCGRYAGLLKLWLRTLPDLGKTSFIEQLNQIGRNHIMNAKNSPTLLLIAALVLGLMSFSHLITPFHGVFMLLVIASALCNLSKAGVELIRPASEWPMVLLRTFILMFIYALFMPAWAKMKTHAAISTPAFQDPFGLFIITCLMTNPLVTVIKLGQFFVQRLKR